MSARPEPEFTIETGWCSLCGRGRIDKPEVLVIAARRPLGMPAPVPSPDLKVVDVTRICGVCVPRLMATLVSHAGKPDPAA